MKARANTRFLWITDPWETLDHPLDTTLRLIEEAATLGLENYWCDVRSIRWYDRSTLLDARTINVLALGRMPTAFSFGDAIPTPPFAFNSIQYRPDPPVDLAYLHPLQLLLLGIERAEGDGEVARGLTEIVNPPNVLLSASEKLEGGIFRDLMPLSIASSRWDLLLQFGISEKHTVLKPLHCAQSKGVELLSWEKRDEIERARQILEAATHGFESPILLQRYLRGVLQGEVRLWFLDGKLLAAARKLSTTDDFRITVDKGAELVATALTEQEKEATLIIGKRLNKRRIRLAAVDLIECKVTDFNFTSPGLLVQFENLLDKNLARDIVTQLARS